MKYQISRISKGDIPDIQKLYQEVYATQPYLIKEAAELEWLFRNPNQEGNFLGYIARTPDHEIAGIIGYALNPYKLGDKVFQGVIPISWMISPAHRGVLGIQLLRKVMGEGDFGFAIQGSLVAQQAYQAVRLKHVAEAHVFTKVTRPLAYLRSGGGFSLAGIMKAFYFLGRNKGAPGKLAARLETVSENQGITHSPVAQLAMVPSVKRTKWLEDCPLVEMLSYTLILDGKNKGPAICYINNQKGIRRGRIVHIPYMGDDNNSYRQAIALLEKELLKQGCCSINALAMQAASSKAYTRQGYKTRKNTARNVFVRDPGNLLDDVALNQWYLTYYESDKAYRSI